MLSQVIEYAKISIISLEQDIEQINDELDKLEYVDSGQEDLELEQVCLNNQIIGIRQILRYCQELDKAVYEGV